MLILRSLQASKKRYIHEDTCLELSAETKAEKEKSEGISIWVVFKAMRWVPQESTDNGEPEALRGRQTDYLQGPSPEAHSARSGADADICPKENTAKTQGQNLQEWHPEAK